MHAELKSLVRGARQHDCFMEAGNCRLLLVVLRQQLIVIACFDRLSYCGTNGGSGLVF